MKKDSTAIGIDLGTTTSCVAVWRNERIEVIKNTMENYITPSYVSYANGNEYIGEEAKNKKINFPESTFYDVKRLIGRRYKDKSVQDDINKLSYKSRIKEKSTGRCIIDIKEINQVYSIEKISSRILLYMKQLAENFLNQKVEDAVITVPAYFNEVQREATRNAGKLAGLNVLRIINEPTSAAIAFGLNNPDINEKYVLIFDLGGGTFDVSILLINKDDISVINTKGISHLGGIDFDERLLNLCIKLFKEETGIDLSNDEKAKRKIRRECETLKHTLSETEESFIDINSIVKGKDLNLTITRAQFEECCEDLFDKCMNCVEEAIQESNIPKDKIDYIIKVGGSSNMPKITEILKEYFNKELLNENLTINLNEAVAIGAAYQAASIDSNINQNKKKILIDIIGISLGYDENGNMKKIFSNKTVIPNQKTIIFENKKNDKDLIIKIYQGENDNNYYNYFLKEFKLKNIEKNDKFEITFKISVDSILSVFAKKIGDDKNFILGEEKTLTQNDINELKKLIEEQKKKKQENEIAKKELLELCFDEYKKNNKNPNAYTIYKWVIENPNQSKDNYEQMKKELYNDEWFEII